LKGEKLGEKIEGICFGWDSKEVLNESRSNFELNWIGIRGANNVGGGGISCNKSFKEN